MADNITFNSFDLQDSNYLTRDIRHRKMANKTLVSRNTLRDGKREILDTWYTEKEIEVSGWIIGSSSSDLRTKIDNLKENLRTEEGNLDIDYGGNTLRYKATVRSLDIPEEHYHITQVPFTIVFSAEPWGKATSTSSETWSSISSSTYTNSINITGSHSPFPLIQITANKLMSTTVKVENETTGDWIQTSSTQSISTNSVIEIDIENQTFQLDSVDIDFDGVFPSFEPNTNSIKVTLSAASPDYDFYIEYYPTYL